jgi:peptidoglycan DL-endopeptidase CwlO
VDFLPKGKSGMTGWRGARGGRRPRLRRGWGRLAAMAAAASALALALPAGAASARPAGGTPTSTLDATVAEANTLANQVDSLDAQFDGLQLQYQQAQAEAADAMQTATRDERALRDGQIAVAQIAAQGYMFGSVSPTIQLLQTSDPQAFLDRSSILLQLNHQQQGTVSLLSQATAAAARAREIAAQEQAQAKKLSSEMAAKAAQAQAKENILNGQAFSQAMAIYDQTGSYPNIDVSGDSIGVQALKWALSRVGDPYVFAAAGPDEFDCSGLTMWAYAQVGISLVHYTGSQWNEGMHVPISQLEPGDLVFFYPDISHVGMYVGDGMMVDAPHTGAFVRVEPIFWDEYEGAVQIVA